MTIKTISIAALLFWLSACSQSETGSPALQQAINASADMLLAQNLSRSAFYAAYPDGKASDYVHYYFSAMGTAEWAPQEGEFSADELKSAHISSIPDNVRFTPNQPAADVPGMQVVIKADDARAVIIFEGYQTASEKPALVVEKPLIKVEPSEFARTIFLSNRDMGIGY
ncbi:MAG: hypothetical protein Q8L15_09805 [Methylobacter sp.]|nr:hypothetical protein [Methylobacter sp.]